LVLATDLSDLRQVQRGEVVLDTGLTYDGIRPVTVRVTKREGRWNFTDDGGAIAAAGRDGHALKFPGSIQVGDYSVNVSRQGEVSLPGFAHSGYDAQQASRVGRRRITRDLCGATGR
jgi:hypothetical protein